MLIPKWIVTVVVLLILLLLANFGINAVSQNRSTEVFAAKKRLLDSLNKKLAALERMNEVAPGNSILRAKTATSYIDFEKLSNNVSVGLSVFVTSWNGEVNQKPVRFVLSSRNTLVFFYSDGSNEEISTFQSP
jgi:hypothetical protein